MKGPETKPTTDTTKRKIPELAADTSPTVRKKRGIKLLEEHKTKPNSLIKGKS